MKKQNLFTRRLMNALRHQSSKAVAISKKGQGAIAFRNRSLRLQIAINAHLNHHRNELVPILTNFDTTCTRKPLSPMCY